MTHYEARLERDLNEIRSRVRAISTRIEEQVRDAVHALLTDDRDLANHVILGDRGINREIRDIDRLCHAFVVRHLPSAGHLRFVSSVLRLDVALERIGDYAGTIGREVVQLSGSPPATVARDIELISHQARRTLSQALVAFHEGNVELARGTLGMADPIDTTFEKVFEDLLEVGESREIPLRDLFGLLRILNLLKRVAEQAENICEETIFTVTGETRDPKTFRILFVDERNDCRSQLAEAYARKAFPESGTYRSAGWRPAREISPAIRSFMDRHGLDARSLEPKLLTPLREEPRHFHVVVALEPGAREHLGEIPFRTVFTEWDVGPCPCDGEEGGEEALEEMYKKLAFRIRDLMETLRGPDAR